MQPIALTYCGRTLSWKPTSRRPVTCPIWNPVPATAFFGQGKWRRACLRAEAESARRRRNGIKPDWLGTENWLACRQDKAQAAAHATSADGDQSRPWSISVFPRVTKMLYLFVFTQFRTEDRFALFPELFRSRRTACLPDSTTTRHLTNSPRWKGSRQRRAFSHRDFRAGSARVAMNPAQ